MYFDSMNELPMPFFDIANAPPTFQYPLCSLRVQIPCHDNGKCVPCVWKKSSERFFIKVKFNVAAIELGRCGLSVRAAAGAATLEPKSLAPKEGHEWFGSKDLEIGSNPNPPEVLLENTADESSDKPSNEDSEQLDEREKLRRTRISKANKGNTPWNKGRKHSAETLRKIKERTRLAMQNPKVKMKLANLWHAQTTETRQKISAGVRMTWDKKREKKMLQENCFFKWQNLIAEASRQGYVGQEELQWDSYETLDKQLKLEWSESVEQRKRMPRVRGNKRAPKTPEQRRKIAEAIYAKWADPEYRERVHSGIAKYHGTEGSERKHRKRPSDGVQSTRKKPAMKKDGDTKIGGKNGARVVNKIQLRKGKSPAYKDPLASSKLEMIKSIRAQRAEAETKQASAVEKARLLIAEAEKAAKALEAAVAKSPIAQASLIESRKLIAEAIRSLESIDKQGANTARHVPSVALTEANMEKDAEFQAPNQSLVVPLNGHRTLSSGGHEFLRPKLVNGDSELHLKSSDGYAYRQRETEQDESDNEYKTEYINGETQPRSTTKKWIRGRLVEVIE